MWNCRAEGYLMRFSNCEARLTGYQRKNTVVPRGRLLFLHETQ